MLCRKQPAFLLKRPVQITEIWEVRISQALFGKIRQLAAQRHVSYSSITRYCVFRLIAPARTQWQPLWRRAFDSMRAANKAPTPMHRHMVCFYGEDIKLLQLAALNLRISVSDLIRIALWLYLPRLTMEIHSRKHVTDQVLYSNGIKRFLRIQPKAHNLLHIPAIRQYTCASFLPWHWWPPAHYGAGAMRLRATAYPITPI